MKLEDYYSENRRIKIKKYNLKLSSDWERIYNKWKVLVDKAIQRNLDFIHYKEFKVSIEFGKMKMKGAKR